MTGPRIDADMAISCIRPFTSKKNPIAQDAGDANARANLVGQPFVTVTVYINGSEAG